MHFLTYEEASRFLNSYPKVREALDLYGMEHALRMLGGVSGDTAERLKRGELLPAEDVEPQRAMSLGELDAHGLDTPPDFYKVRAAAYLYAAHRVANAA